MMTRRLRFGLLVILLSAAMPSLAETETEWVYSFSKGDNIWNLAHRLLKDPSLWRELVQLNQVKNPRQMPPGSRVKIPLHWLKVEAATVQALDVQGQVVRISADGQPKPLLVGARLKQGERLRLGADGRVLLGFADGTRQLLAPNTEIELVRTRKFTDVNAADTTVRLLKGGADNHVPVRGSRFELRTPAANTTVRGTRFSVNLDTQHSRVSVLEGNVAVGSEKSGRELPAGYGAVVASDGPVVAQQLLAAPKRLFSETDTDLPLQLKWQPVSGAVAYLARLMQLSPQEKLLAEQRLQRPSFGFDRALPAGRFRVSLRALAENGLEGMESALEFTVDTPLTAPTIEVRTVSESIVLVLHPGYADKRYQLQIAGDRGFGQLLFDTTIDEPRWQAQKPVSKVYFRARMIDERGGMSGWGPVVAVLGEAVATP